MKTSDILERVLLCPRTAFLANEVVDLQRVQCAQFANFMNKYMNYLESKC